MPPHKISRGWPAHFYNEDGNIRCPAEGCSKIFETEAEFRVPNPHWNLLPDPSLPTHNDHSILQVVHSQLRCAFCNFDSGGNLKALFAHEKAHASSKMSSIEGYLSLMRSGQINGVGDPWDEAFNRLVVKILATDYKPMMLFKAWPNLLRVPAEQEQERLSNFLEQQNVKAGLDAKAVISADEFLYDIRPGDHDDSAWPEAYNALRSMYAQGTI